MARRLKVRYCPMWHPPQELQADPQLDDMNIRRNYGHHPHTAVNDWRERREPCHDKLTCERIDFALIEGEQENMTILIYFETETLPLNDVEL